MNDAGGHSQTINLALGMQDVTYILVSQCSAFATPPTRSDGLFKFVEDLDELPGPGWPATNSCGEPNPPLPTDILGFCFERHGWWDTDTDFGNSAPMGDPPGDGSLGGGSLSENDLSGDDGSESGDVSSTGGGADVLLTPCGPYAKIRPAVNPTDNFAAWNQQSSGVGSSGNASYSVVANGGGVEYKRLPCPPYSNEAPHECLRLDRLSADIVEPHSEFSMRLFLVEKTALVPISTSGEAIFPVGDMKFAAHFMWDSEQIMVLAQNAEATTVMIDSANGALEFGEVTASDQDGNLMANLTLVGELVNTQPNPSISSFPGTTWDRIVLVAQTVDAESDPIIHHWMIPGVGTWTGDGIELQLPVGRHAVILYADDIHRARGITATWVEISEPTR